MQYQEKPVGIFGWIFTIILLCIPVVNVITVIFFLFGGGRSKTRTNLFRGILVGALLFFGIVWLVDMMSPAHFEEFKEMISTAKFHIENGIDKIVNLFN